MENARVVINEDDELVMEVTIRKLRATGRQVVGQASTRQEALDLVDSMERLKLT